MQTRSGTAACGPVELFYEGLGEPGDPPVLLIMGVGAQLPMRPDGFCAQLLKQGVGHDLPEPVWRPVVEALTENFAIAARPV